MEQNAAARLGSGSVVAERWLIGAQLLALVALACVLLFLTNTTGGTVFLFSLLAPLLVLAASAIVLGVAIARFRKRHSLFEFETVAPGQIIFREGDTGDCAYFIQDGEVEVVCNNTGTEAVVARLGPGQYFGEMALLSNQPRNATVRTVTATKLALIGKRNFITMLGVLPSARREILRTVQQRSVRGPIGRKK
jgi:hypothetical protein